MHTKWLMQPLGGPIATRVKERGDLSGQFAHSLSPKALTPGPHPISGALEIESTPHETCEKV